MSLAKQLIRKDLKNSTSLDELKSSNLEKIGVQIEFLQDQIREGKISISGVCKFLDLVRDFSQEVNTLADDNPGVEVVLDSIDHDFDFNGSLQNYHFTILVKVLLDLLAESNPILSLSDDLSVSDDLIEDLLYGFTGYSYYGNDGDTAFVEQTSTILYKLITNPYNLDDSRGRVKNVLDS